MTDTWHLLRGSQALRHSDTTHDGREKSRICQGLPGPYDFFNVTRGEQASEVLYRPLPNFIGPAFAIRVVVAPLSCNAIASSGDDDFGDALREYFTQARLIHADDVFYVPSTCSWFKALTVEAPGVDVDTHIDCGVVQCLQTTMLLRSVAHCRRPTTHDGNPDIFVAPIVSSACLLSTAGCAPIDLKASSPWTPAAAPSPLVQRKRGSAVDRAISDAYATLQSPLGRARAAYPAILLHGGRGSGKRTQVLQASERHGLALVEIDAMLLRLTIDAKMQREAGSMASAVANEVYAVALAARPCVAHVRHVESLLAGTGNGNLPESHAVQLALALATLKARLSAAWLDIDPAHARNDDHTVILVCSFCVADISAIPDVVRDTFSSIARVRSPSHRAILRNLQSALEKVLIVDSTARDAVCAAVGGPLVGLPWQTIAAFQRYVVEEALDELAGHGGDTALHVVAEAEAAIRDRKSVLSTAAVAKALTRLQSLNPALADAPKIPNVRYEDVGGADDAKRAVVDMIDLPLKRPDLFKGGVRPRTGLLLYGPPGVGKTLIAKAIATECGVNFLSIKGPELLNMYVGESERNVRLLFARARAAAPCVVFFDELDSIASRTGSAADGGGVVDRVVSQLLTELDQSSVAHDAASDCASDTDTDTDDRDERDWASFATRRPRIVFFLGATNRPDLLEPSLLRPGRLDQLVYLGVSADPASKLAVLQAQTRRFKLAPDVSLEAIAHACPPTLTGADLYALCAAAMSAALKRRVQAIVGRHGCDVTSRSDVPVCSMDTSSGHSDRVGPLVMQEDFLEALDNLRPSVSPAELARYETMRADFEGRKR